jgi:polysaccharide biosynthesis transport protein
MSKISRALQKDRAERGAFVPQPNAAPVTPAPRQTNYPPPTAAATLAETERKLQPVKGAYAEPDHDLVAYHERDGDYASMFRALRTRMLAPDRKGAPRVIVVTSGSSGEGKTTVCTNLATIFAESANARILVIDADVYQPQVARLFGLTPTLGIGDILVRNMDLTGVIYETAIPNVHVLPATNNIGLKGSEVQFDLRMAEMLRRLRPHYDFIFVDTPPVMSTSHAAVIGKHADGVIVVARAEKTSRQVVNRAIKELKDGGAEVLGCVLTHVKYHIPKYVYSLFGTTSDRYYRHFEQEAKAIQE